NMLFGAGESTWFPERAADFILREHLPGNLFQTYNLGGFSAWRLGPAYSDFIDGRNVSQAVATEYGEFLSSPPDSAPWEAETTRRGINILLFSLARTPGLGSPGLDDLCKGQSFRPVYMDEVSIVLLRNSAQNRAWLDRFPVDCGKQQFPPPAHASSGEMGDFYANVGHIEMSLGRISEAEEALNRSIVLTPED